MDAELTPEQQRIVVALFQRNATVREIAEKTGIDRQRVLCFLTRRGLWSLYCSECVLKRCYDCRGLSELGKPISIQDEVDLAATFKRLGGGHEGETA